MNYFYYWLCYLGLLILMAFLTMGTDKRRAVQKKWRISEKTIWILSIMGGATGSYIGMKVFRHKTKHRLFKYGLPLLSLLHVIITAYFLGLRPFMF